MWLGGFLWPLFVAGPSFQGARGIYSSTQQNFGALHATPSSDHRYDEQVAHDPIHSANNLGTRSRVTELPNKHLYHSAFDDLAGSLECQTQTQGCHSTVPRQRHTDHITIAFFSAVCASSPASSAMEKATETRPSHPARRGLIP